MFGQLNGFRLNVRNVPKELILVLGLMLLLQGCAGTIIGSVVDATIEIAKVPFKVGGAIVDVVRGDKEEKKEDKQLQKPIDRQAQDKFGGG